MVDFKHGGRVLCLFARVTASVASASTTMRTHSWDNEYSQTAHEFDEANHSFNKQEMNRLPR